jgi:hypothetical protein
MTRLRLLAFLLLVNGVSDRVFACESRVGADGETYQICHSRGEFRAAARAAGVDDLGIETFDRLRTGFYGFGVFSPLYDDPFGAWFGASGGSDATLAIVAVTGSVAGHGSFIGKALRGQTGFYNIQLGLGSTARTRAIGFDFFDEPVAQYTPVSVIVNLGGVTCCGVFELAQSAAFIGIVSPKPFNTVGLVATSYGTMMLDSVEYAGGAPSGPDNPYPPEPCPNNEMIGAVWCFTGLAHPAWYDPSPATGYEFRTLDGSFVAIDDFPPGFSDAFAVSADGVSLGRFAPGQRVAFPPGVTQFRITGITPAVEG